MLFSTSWHLSASLFLSHLLTAITAAPAGRVGLAAGNATSPSFATNTTELAKWVPQWAADACLKFPPTICDIVDGIPKIKTNSHKSATTGAMKGKVRLASSAMPPGLQAPSVEGAGSPNQSNSSIGVDGNPDNDYAVDLSPEKVAMGLCDPAVFLDLLWFASCPLGNSALKCSGKATYDCFYHDDKQQDVHPAVDPAEDYPEDTVGQCTMAYSAEFSSNARRAIDPVNTTLADFAKSSTVRIYRSLTEHEGGNYTGPLIPGDWTGLPNMTTYSVPRTMTFIGTHAHAGMTEENSQFLKVSVDIDCPLPPDSFSCSKFTDIVSTISDIVGLAAPVVGSALSLTTSAVKKVVSAAEKTSAIVSVAGNACPDK